ncbi:flagellar basal body rod protein FlgC [Nitrincola tibetensis]|uniref:Flagellar basal-body rod protein FlgC n=1 Tax=Nitrincola tibetensis TaxID=2219697 RepID=A0A364NRB3_9GAMM|nr:flagellar basal body rod protein FlgC [Nitrincola tibetensis]RAU19623.1 flagellar basal body rod protein FlgC [Nitrincola tibetensis]
MSLSNVFGIAGSAMSAQTIRLNTTASNMANAESVSSSEGETYRARKPVFALKAPEISQLGETPTGLVPGQGVQVLDVIESQTPLRMAYEPNHPLSNEQGYVFYPNVNVIEEMADMISASRSFQINADVLNTTKQMLQKTMTLGQG